MTSDEEKVSRPSTPEDDDIHAKIHAATEPKEIALEDSELAVNWTARRKTITFATIWMFTLCSPMASSMCAPSIGLVLEEFGNSSRIYGAWVLSVYVLGYAFGPLLVAPLSELYGRLPVYHTFNTLFLVFMIACAVSTSLGMLSGFRFLAGLAGSCPVTLGAGSIGDISKPDRRGAMIAIWTIGPLAGPAIGPVAGGFLSQAKGWRWIYWLLAIIWGATLVASYIFMEETYAPVLFRKKRARILGIKRNSFIPESDMSIRELFWVTISRPVKMLFLCLDVFSLSLYQTFVYGVYYIFVTTMVQTFTSVYGFGPGIVGLSYIGFGVGAVAGSLICGYMSDSIMKRWSAKSGERRPEYRLPPIIPGSLFTPIGLLWFGWSVQARAHWIVPIIGTVPIGIGVAACFMPSGYFIEAYPRYVASAIAASTLLRSIGGAVLPLAGPSLYSNLDQGWGNTLLAGISILVCPMTVVLYKYSGLLRQRSSFGAGG